MFIPMYRKGRALNFGKKYPGMKIEAIIVKDPEYVIWCLEHVEHFDLDNELYGMLEDSIKANNEKRNREYWNSLRERTDRREVFTLTPAENRIQQSVEQYRGLGNGQVEPVSREWVVEIDGNALRSRIQEYMNSWPSSEA